MCIWDASPTWSGYLYQGKVAIYHMLSIICEKLVEGKRCLNSPEESTRTSTVAECGNLSMELEQIEDFSIRDITGRYLTVHQVKAYKSQESSQYKEAISKLTENIKKYSDGVYIPMGFLHTIKEVQLDYGNINISSYEYSINGKRLKCCDLDEIELLIKEKVTQFSYLHNKKVLEEDEAEILCLVLKNAIDEMVRERHKNIDVHRRGNFEV